MSGIDLHTHSAASDGTVPPGELMLEAQAAGLTAVALTDHDTTEGWAAAAAALPPALTLVPGAELSCLHDEAGVRVSLHLLAYLFDPDEPALLAARRRLRSGRVDRGRAIVEALLADGHPISWDEVLADAGGGSVGRPHIARALVRARLVPDVPSAFTPDWIADGGRYYRDKVELEILEALALVRAAGGVAVFAHPGAARRGPVVSADTIAALAAAGLAGLEIDHIDHDPGTRRRLRGLADDLDLLVTGGSDYHGTSKAVRLGAERTAPEVLDALVARASGTSAVHA